MIIQARVEEHSLIQWCNYVKKPMPSIKTEPIMTRDNFMKHDGISHIYANGNDVSEVMFWTITFIYIE
jgi:hypothetical protein